MATYNSDGTTTYVPGESNARAVPPDAGTKESGEVVHEGTPPSHVETRVGTAPGHVTAPKHPHAR
jgi:hypothetical protein